jgi:hypothetical protein
MLTDAGSSVIIVNSNKKHELAAGNGLDNEYNRSYLCSRMLAYADVCSRMRTYADVCGRKLTTARCFTARRQHELINIYNV